MKTQQVLTEQKLKHLGKYFADCVKEGYKDSGSCRDCMHKEILTFVVIGFADTVALNLYMSQKVQQIVKNTTPRKLREWIETTSISWLARRMRLPETVVSEMIERIRHNQ